MFIGIYLAALCLTRKSCGHWARKSPSVEAPLALSDFTVTNELKTGGDMAKLLGLTMTRATISA